MTESVLFPAEQDIPEQYRIDAPLEQRHYLRNGEIVNWKGPRQEVLSPVCVSSGSCIIQKTIGSYPLLDEEDALEVMEAA